jgi:polyphosphate:AMP phosphotransferase
MYRFWRALPPKGSIGIFFGSWYTQPIVRRVYGETKTPVLEQNLDEILRFEQMLADEGALLVKFWFHLSKDQQKTRLKSLQAHAKTRWRVTDLDWKHFALYDKFRKISERALRRTSTAHAPWIVVEGKCPRFRSLTVSKALLEAMRRRLEQDAQTHAAAPDIHAAPLLEPIDQVKILDRLDMSRALTKKDYDDELAQAERTLNLLTRKPGFKDVSVVALFEGPDAAGKGGAIRRITGALDARQYRVNPVAAPTEEERAQPYLWRFWRHLPRKGRCAIFDRSWYGRVLVERVEGFCSRGDWMRAYGEINDFEEQLVQNRTVLAKFWLHITQDEQLRRFEERQKISFKQYKITGEDWRNREKWASYEQAACDMIDRTSTEIAPWTVVEANDKYWGRIRVIKTLCERIEEAMR